MWPTIDNTIKSRQNKYESPSLVSYLQLNSQLPLYTFLINKITSILSIKNRAQRNQGPLTQTKGNYWSRNRDFSYHIYHTLGYITSTRTIFRASQVVLVIKNLPAMQVVQETQVWSLGQKDPWWRDWPPTPVSLPGELQGQRSLEVYSPRGCTESDRTEQLSTCIYLKK